MLLDISETSSNISFFCLNGNSRGLPRSAVTSVLEGFASYHEQTDRQTVIHSEMVWERVNESFNLAGPETTAKSWKRRGLASQARGSMAPQARCLYHPNHSLLKSVMEQFHLICLNLISFLIYKINMHFYSAWSLGDPPNSRFCLIATGTNFVTGHHFDE